MNEEVKVEILSPTTAIVNKCRSCGVPNSRLRIIRILDVGEGKVIAWAICNCGEVYRFYR